MENWNCEDFSMKLLLSLWTALSLSSLFVSLGEASFNSTADNIVRSDKIQNPAEISSKRTIVLPKNIQMIGGEKKNILTQDMFNKDCGKGITPCSNTTFVIKYKFDLNGQTIQIPSGCTIVFNSGSFNNGTVIGNYCKYEGKGFGQNLVYKDFVKYKKGIIYVDDLTNSATATSIDDYNSYNIATILNYTIKECYNDYGSVKVIFGKNKKYGFRSPVFLLDNTTIEGNGCSIVFPSNKSRVYSMDGVQAFLTNRTHTSINGNTNDYTTEVLGCKNITIKNIVFSNVNEMRNFGYNVNCERGFIAMYGAENVLIDGIVAEDINTAHCAVWCVNMNDFEIKNCSFSQHSGFNSNGAGGIWSTKADYMHNINIHHNRFAFYGDESVNVEMATCAKNNRIVVSNNYIKGSLLTVIHNKDTKTPISSLVYSNNTLDDVTGIVNSKYQGNPRPLLISGDIECIDYTGNVVSADTEVSLIRFYRPCHVEKVNMIKNEAKGNVNIIIDNDAYIQTCSVKNNKGVSFSFKPNLSVLKEAIFLKNSFYIPSNTTLVGGGARATITIKKNLFRSSDSKKRTCYVEENDGKLVINDNKFVSTRLEQRKIDKHILVKNNVFLEK